MATNFVPEPEELEQLIIDTVRKTVSSGKRVSSKYICDTLLRTHGLDSSPTMLQLTLMIATGKLKDVPWRGKESLKVAESMPGSQVESVSDKDKPRKLSNDEGRLKACRNELQSVAEAEKQISDENSDSSDSSDSETESSQSETDTEQMKSGSRSNLEIPRIYLKNMDTDLEETKQRLHVLEEKFEKIEKNVVLQLNSSMNKNSDAEKAKKDFEMKIEKLETEKNLLVDENFGLRLQILDLKALLQVKSNQVNAQGELSPSKNPFCDNFVIKDGPWQFPKQTTKIRQFGMDPLKTAVPLMNSFGALTDMEDNEIWQNAPNYENQQVLFPRGLGNKEKLTKTVNSIIMNTAPSEKRFEDNIVTNRQVIDERRKEKKNVVPCEKTWAEAAKTGSTETIRDKLNTTQYSPQVSRQNTVKFRHHQEGRPNDVQITQDTRADFTWEDFDEDADQHKWSFNGKEKRKPVVSIIGDSILGGIRKQEMNKHVRGNFTIVKSFKGATVNDMESYIIPTLNRKPDGLIIHCGTNDLRDSEPTEIARKITKLAVNASKTVKNVAVSSILARGDSELIDVKRRKVNIALEKELENSRIELIKHEYIEREWENMLYKDGIHLNQDGTNALGGDFVSFLNSV